jgi:hypothetical protein
MNQQTGKGKQSLPNRTASKEVDNVPGNESLVIRQRLRNLIELAIAIGQREGLLGNNKTVNSPDLEGGHNVSNQRDTK